MRTTGATDEQIEAAARRMLAVQSGSVRKISERYLQLTAREAQYWCPPDHRIVRVDDLRALLAVAELHAKREFVERIEALIGEAE